MATATTSTIEWRYLPETPKALGDVLVAVKGDGLWRQAWYAPDMYPRWRVGENDYIGGEVYAWANQGPMPPEQPQGA